MTTAEFLEITEEIEKFYDKEYTKDQSKYMYEELQKLSKARYRQIARQAFKTCKFMPKLADLVEIEKEIPKEIINKQHERVECKRCKGTGLVPYKKLVNTGSRNIEYLTVARCECINATGISQEIPLASEIGI